MTSQRRLRRKNAGRNMRKLINNLRGSSDDEENTDCDLNGTVLESTPHNTLLDTPAEDGNLHNATIINNTEDDNNVDENGESNAVDSNDGNASDGDDRNTVSDDNRSEVSVNHLNSVSSSEFIDFKEYITTRFNDLHSMFKQFTTGHHNKNFSNDLEIQNNKLILRNQHLEFQIGMMEEKGSLLNENKKLQVTNLSLESELQFVKEKNDFLLQENEKLRSNIVNLTTSAHRNSSDVSNKPPSIKDTNSRVSLDSSHPTNDVNTFYEVKKGRYARMDKIGSQYRSNKPASPKPVELRNRYSNLHQEETTVPEDQSSEICQGSRRKPPQPKLPRRRPPIAYGEKYVEKQEFPPRHKRYTPGIHTYAEKVKHGRKVLITGDSHISRINRNNFRESMKHGYGVLCPFPGATAEDMEHYIIPVLKKHEPDTVILHVGSNNIISKSVRSSCTKDCRHWNTVYNLMCKML